MTDRDRYQRIKDIFHAVCDLSSAERDALLDERCAGAPDVRAEVLSLLGVESSAPSGILDRPLAELGRMITPGARAPAPAGDAVGLPTQFGRYRIVGTLGVGGMGIVYQAEQDSPKRTVALKVIRGGFASESLARRFRQEAEVLGRLQHPGIAHIYEAGVAETPGGQQPYFAMQFVAGQPLTEHARAAQLDVRSRLALFGRVCEAVQHAHERGVIHRDLKPANILVDASGQPKVLDFGIARLTDPQSPWATMQTAEGQVVGTLAYMSPEQVSGGGGDVDTRSDVYSLGVALYELLAGRLPHDVTSCSLAQAARVITEREPLRLREVDRTFRGDVETIVSKALEKDRSRRYATAGELAADIQRYLANLPLLARPASTTYQLRKFAARNRVLVGAAGLCLLLLLGGIAGTTAGLISARRANRQLSTALTRSQQVSKLMRAMLRSASPAIAGVRDTTLLREILEGAVKRMDAGEIADQPAVEAEMRATIADTYNALGDNEAALRVIEPAIRLARAAPADEAGHFQRARLAYATLLTVWGRNAEAKAAYEQAMEIQRGLPEDELASDLYSNFGGLLSTLGKTEQALDLHRRALAIRRRVLGDKHAGVAASMGNIAGCLKDLGRYDEAIAMMHDVLKAYREAKPPLLLHITIVQNNLAGMLLLAGRPVEAEAAARDSLAIGEKIYQPKHQQLGMSAHTLGLALRAQGRHEEAREQFARAAEILKSAFNEDHPFVATARMDLGHELIELGRYADAEPELLAAQHIFSMQGGPENENANECAQLLVRLFEAWDKADPRQHHEAQIQQWKAATQPAASRPSRDGA